MGFNRVATIREIKLLVVRAFLLLVAENIITTFHHQQAYIDSRGLTNSLVSVDAGRGL